MKGKRHTQFIEEKTILCAQYLEDIENIKYKMEEMRESTLTSNERIKRIENMIDKEEKFHAICVADTEKINSTLYRLDKLCLEQKEIGKSLELNINNTTCNCTQLRRHIRQMKTDLDKIKEVVYDMVRNYSYRGHEINSVRCEIGKIGKSLTIFRFPNTPGFPISS